MIYVFIFQKVPDTYNRDFIFICKVILIMIMYVLLKEAKKHCNIDFDFTDDDDYLKYLISVAEDAVSKHIGKDLKDTVKNGVIEPAVKQSILLMIGNLYANREIDSYGTATEVPFGYRYLANLNKNWFIP